MASSREGEGEVEEEGSRRAEDELRSLWLWRIRDMKKGVTRLIIDDLDMSRFNFYRKSFQ